MNKATDVLAKFPISGKGAILALYLSDAMVDRLALDGTPFVVWDTSNTTRVVAFKLAADAVAYAADRAGWPTVSPIPTPDVDKLNPMHMQEAMAYQEVAAWEGA